jgi:hypothetical protein
MHNNLEFLVILHSRRVVPRPTVLLFTRGKKKTVLSKEGIS